MSSFDKSVKDSKYSVELIDVSFGYTPDKLIINNLNLKLDKQKYICILGHNGSGKSTLSKLLMGLSKAQSGTIKISGIELDESNYRKALHKICLVFQNPDSQFIGLTAEDDIAFGLENRNIPKPLIKKIIDNVSKFLNIESLLHLQTHSLSGGQKQKISIASILALNPEIIIFDESTSMLDDWSKNEILGIMRKLVNHHNKTIISVTHDMEELLLADEVVLMKSGEVLFHSDLPTLLKNTDIMKSSNLELPFIYKLSNSLKDKGIDIGLNFNNEDDLIHSLAKLRVE